MAKGMTKSEFMSTVAEKTGMSKRDVNAVMEAMDDIIKSELKNSGEVTIPGLLKLTVVHREAVPERPGINPFTKEPTIFKAKPATNAVKARPVKALKDAVAPSAEPMMAPPAEPQAS